MSTKILAISPHPDDVEIGCGGYIQRFDERHILTVTCGEVGGPINDRISEAHNAADLLKAEVRFMHEPDTKVQVTSLIPRFKNFIWAMQPDVICIPTEFDTHQDHRAVHEAVMVAARDHMCTILSYATPSSIEFFTPNWFVELSEEQIRLKLKAVACHISQKDKMYSTEEWLISVTNYWGHIVHSKSKCVEPLLLERHWEKL
jgi:LmbE family N-acetylglucosaminyl deacetylase